MKLKYEFTLREIMGEYIMVPVGEGALAVSGMGTTNEVGAYICELLAEERSYEQLLEAILGEFEVDEATARTDLEEFLSRLRTFALLHE